MLEQQPLKYNTMNSQKTHLNKIVQNPLNNQKEVFNILHFLFLSFHLKF